MGADAARLSQTSEIWQHLKLVFRGCFVLRSFANMLIYNDIVAAGESIVAAARAATVL